MALNDHFNDNILPVWPWVVDTNTPGEVTEPVGTKLVITAGDGPITTTSVANLSGIYQRTDQGGGDINQGPFDFTWLVTDISEYGGGKIQGVCCKITSVTFVSLNIISETEVQAVHTSGGSPSAAIENWSGSLPLWLRITRVADVFHTYFSENGSDWTEIIPSSPLDDDGYFHAYMHAEYDSGDINTQQTVKFDFMWNTGDGLPEYTTTTTTTTTTSYPPVLNYDEFDNGKLAPWWSTTQEQGSASFVESIPNARLEMTAGDGDWAWVNQSFEVTSPIDAFTVIELPTGGFDVENFYTVFEWHDHAGDPNGIAFFFQYHFGNGRYQITINFDQDGIPSNEGIQITAGVPNRVYFRIKYDEGQTLRAFYSFNLNNGWTEVVPSTVSPTWTVGEEVDLRLYTEGGIGSPYLESNLDFIREWDYQQYTTTTTTTTTTLPFETWDDIYYYRSTQAIANRLPDWTRGQADKYSNIQQLLHPAGKELEALLENMRRASNSLFLRSMDMRSIDLTYQIELPYSFEFEFDFTDPTNPRPKPPDTWGIVDGNIYEISAVADNDIESFWYEPIGDRISFGPDETIHDVGDVSKLATGDVLPATDISIGKLIATYTDPLVPGRLYVTLSNAEKFDFTNKRIGVPGYIELQGVTVKESEETERIPFSFNATLLTQKFWKEITDVIVFNIEPGNAQLTITSAAGTMQQISDPTYIDYDTTQGRASFWEIEEVNSQTVLQQIMPVARVVETEVRMGFQLDVFREWTLIDATGFAIDYANVVDYTLEAYRPYLYVLTSDGEVSIYNKLPEYPNIDSMRILKQRTAGPKSVIYASYEEGLVDDQIRLSLKTLTKSKPVVFYYLEGAKPHHEGELQYISTSGVWGATLAESRVSLITPTVNPPYKPYLIDLEEGGCYTFVLTTRYVDGTEDKDVKIIWSRYKMPIASFDLLAADPTLTTPLAICFDYDQRLWVGGMYDADFKFKVLNLHADLMLIDYEKKLLYLREEYDRVWVGENDPTTSTTTTSTTTTTTTTAPMFQDDDFENGSLESFWTTDFGVGGAYAEEGGAGNLSSSAEGLFGGGVVEFGWIYQGDPDFEGDFNIRVQIGDFTNMTDNGMICGIVAYVDNNNWALIGKRWYYGLERHATHRVAGTYRQTPDTEDDASDPQWYRIERVGSTFNTYWSNNGTSWNLLNPPSGNLSHSGAVKIGFFASDENSQPPGPFDANFFIIENI